MLIGSQEYDLGVQPGPKVSFAGLFTFQESILIGLDLEGFYYFPSPLVRGYTYNSFGACGLGIIFGAEFVDLELIFGPGKESFGLIINPGIFWGYYPNTNHAFFAWDVSLGPFLRLGNFMFTAAIAYTSFPAYFSGLGLDLTVSCLF